MTILLKDLVYTLIRYLVVMFATWLVSKGVFTHDQFVAWTQPDVILYIAGGVAAVGIGLWKTYRSRLKFLAALRAPIGTTEAEIHEDLKLTDRNKLLLCLLPAMLSWSVLLAAPFTQAACASSSRARVAQSYQQTQIGLGAVQDAELALYKSGALPALTLERHQSISLALVKAFEAQIVFGNALLVWRSDGVPPPEYETWLQSIDTTLVALDDLLPKDQGLLNATLVWTRNAVAVIRGLGLAVPPAFARRVTP